MLHLEKIVGRSLDMPANLMSVRRPKEECSEDQHVERPRSNSIRSCTGFFTYDLLPSTLAMMVDLRPWN